MKEYSDEESEDDEYIIVGREGVGHAHNDHRPVTGQNDRFTSELVRQSGADHSAEYDADDKYCLCEVLEICTFADQVPLQ